MGAPDYPMQSASVDFHMAWLALNNNKTISSVRRIENLCHNNKKILKKTHFCLLMKLQVTIMFFF
jgi:hypothetical protein